MKTRIVTLLLLHYLSLASFAQSNSDKDFDFIVEKIQNEYSGYIDKTNDSMFSQFIKVVKLKSEEDEFSKLSKLTNYFNDNHLLLYDYSFLKKNDSFKCKEQYNSVIKKLTKLKQYNDAIEGFWLSEYNNCVIGVVKTSASPLTYEGYVVETKKKALPGYRLFKMVKKINENRFLTDYCEENLEFRVFLNSRIKNSNTIYLNSYGKFTKLKFYKKGILNNFKVFKFDCDLSKLNNKTLLLKLPDFGGQNITVIDSIIRVNDSLLSQANTLIIDVRNNMGGRVRNYFPLFPFFCTNDIYRVSSFYRSTDSYINKIQSKILKFIELKDSISSNDYNIFLDTLIKHKGEMIFVQGDTIFCSINKNRIKNIGLIINNNCLSATELMILDFKQSKNVKVFGEITGGAVDYLNTNDLETPSKKYTITIPSHKRLIIKNQPKYDNVGIKPDIEIPSSVSNWINFVKKYYEEKRN